jgi:RND family efflux transporter MFP subunit
MSTKNADLSSLQIDPSKREDSKNPDAQKRNYYRIAILAVIIVAIFLLITSDFSLFSTKQEVTLVSASLQSPAQANAILSASGYVVAQRKAAVASKGTGRLVYLGVVEGDVVKKDQIIARLENDDIQAQLNEAKANLKVQIAELKVAENNFRRQKELFASELASELDVDDAESKYFRVLASIELAKALIQGAEVAMENTRIRAPYDGTVLTKNADIGEIVAPMAAGVNSRAAVVTIADMSSLQVETDVSESNIEKISQGLGCEISLDAYPNKRYKGYVDKIVPTADRAKATVLVKVGFETYDERVLPEMSAKVLFLTEGERVDTENQELMLVIPNTAMRSANGKNYVYKVNEDLVQEIEIEAGKNLGMYTEIISGLKNGDRVIRNLNDQISDGTSVIVN